MALSKVRQTLNRQTTTTPDTMICSRIFYTGTGVPTIAVGATAVDGAAGDMTFLVDAVADTNVNVDGSIDESAEAATLGAMADLVNASTGGFWHYILVDTLRTGDSSDVLAVATGQAVDAIDGFDLNWDSSLYLAATLSIGAEALGTDYGPAWDRLSAADQFFAKDVQEVASSDTNVLVPTLGETFKLNTSGRLLQIIGNLGVAAGAASLAIYSSSQSEDTLLETLPFADAVATTVTFDENEIISAPGRRLVITSVTTALDAWNLIVNGQWGEPGETI